MQSSRCHNVMTIYQLFHARAVCHASQARSGGFVRGHCCIHDGNGLGRPSCHYARCRALHGGDVTPRTASHGEELMCPMPSTTVLLTIDAGQTNCRRAFFSLSAQLVSLFSPRIDITSLLSLSPLSSLRSFHGHSTHSYALTLS